MRRSSRARASSRYSSTSGHSEYVRFMSPNRPCTTNSATSRSSVARAPRTTSKGILAKRGQADDVAVRGLTVGTHEIIVSTPPGSGGSPLTVRVPVTVEWPAIARLESDIHQLLLLKPLERLSEGRGATLGPQPSRWRASLVVSTYLI